MTDTAPYAAPYAAPSARDPRSELSSSEAGPGGNQATDPRTLLRWVDRAFGQRAALVSSLGPQTLVVLDMLHREGIELPVLFIDTGLHFLATYVLRSRLESRYGVEIRNIEPELGLARQAELLGDRLWERDPDLCCSLRKVEPLRQALQGFDAWITGVRRSQSPSRSQAGWVEWDPVYSMTKINPLVNWSSEEVRRYLADFDVPYNPLLDEGYTSIGCSPCTQQPPSEDASTNERSGRWSGSSKNECGLHQPIDVSRRRLRREA